MSILIDIEPLSYGCADHALEVLHKAMSEDDDIWREHENVFIRELVKRVSEKGIAHLDNLKKDLLSWIGKTPTGPRMAKPVVGMVGRWTVNEMAAAYAYLSGIPKTAWKAEDYQLLVDYLVQRHFPDNPIQWADYIVKRSVMMGKIQAVSESVTEHQARQLLNHFSNGKIFETLGQMAGLNQTIIDYGIAHCADLIQSIEDSSRHQIKRIVLDHQKNLQLGIKPEQSLQTRLFDTFSQLNRDWRRIAVTEPGEMANQGFVASVAAGEKLRRVEQYHGACPFCRKWDGKILTVVPPDKPDKDWEKEIWIGKNNSGRSVSPYKRVDGKLVKRSANELLMPAAGLFHPHCRGMWLRVAKGAEPDEFTAWLNNFLKDIK
ncbi:hypothetical protein [Oxalobacter paraformigenes]|uniref:Phage head morphogenesis domain-containing protein n=1 Tax=Oxalobacter paraformigenes TaxID=556268 RepID=T5LSZ4_9BURK|nr:hypothetical protein [Oxalobacter paraformigenes]EQM95174.1 hypothetical protein OFAG_02270 [Oxalobacter paraformigenes]